MAGGIPGSPSKSEPDVSFLLGLPFHRLTMAETVAEAIAVVEAGKPRYLITANADFVAQAHENKHLREIIVYAHRAVVDGMPLVWLSRLFPPRLPERVAGSDLVFELFRQGSERGWRFFFLGSDASTLVEVESFLSRSFPGLTVAGRISPPYGAIEDWPNEEIAAQIRESRPQVLLVAVGCPKQEFWISRYARDLAVPLSIGIGASLDFISGRQVRAPRWMQKTGLEWVWRMGTDPGRLASRYWKDFRYLCRLGWLQWRLTRRRQARPLDLRADAPSILGFAPGVQRLSWAGTVEASNLHLHSLPSEGTCHVLLDLSDVTFMDSAGVGHLIQVSRRCREAEQAFALLQPSPQVRKIIAALRLESQLPVLESAGSFPPDSPSGR